MYQSNLRAWTLKTCLAITIIIAFVDSLYAQTNYLTAFGNAGCNYTNRISCLATPGSGTVAGVANPNDVFVSRDPINAKPFFAQNTIYDKSGNILFSVSGDGIFASNGDMVFQFSTGILYHVPCSGYTEDYTVNAGISTSEICVVPVPCSQNSYYVIFWCGAWVPPYSNYKVLRAVRVDIDLSKLGGSGSTSTWYSFTDNLLGQQPDCSGYQYNFVTNVAGAFEVVADAPNSDQSRDIYTAYMNTSGYPEIRQWTIDAAGNLPTTSIKISTDMSMPNYAPAVTKAKIFHLPASGGGTDKILAYPAGPAFTSSLPAGYYLQTFNITNSSHPVSLYAVPVASTHDPIIYGFEYIPGLNKYLISYDEIAYDLIYHVPNGGLAYAAPASSGYISTTALSSTTHYYQSDLELNKNGDLLMVYDDNSGVPGTPGVASLAYIDKSYLTSLSSITTAVASIVIPTKCGSNVSITNVFSRQDPYSGQSGWYLGSQIREDNYAWGADILPSPYIISSNTTWTPASNPVATASGVTTPIISANNIIVQPGATLAIQNMTVTMMPNSYVDVYASTSATSPGGRIILDHATLTHNIAGCNGSGSMWGGVRVWGKPYFDQYPLTTTGQGIITMSNSSEISYAHTGVFLGPNPGLFSPMCGGIIRAYNSKFYNNNNSVVFTPYFYMGKNNASYFQQCTFNSDDANTVTGYGCTGILKHIVGDNVRGVKIYGCTFQNNTGLTTGTYGIYGDDMGFTAGGFRTGIFGTGGYSFTPGKFENFNTAIYQHTIQPKAVTVSGCLFNNNEVGVELDGTISPIVTYNTFNVPYAYTAGVPRYYSFAQSIGVVLNTANLYTVSNNNFVISFPSLYGPPVNHTVGVLARNTGGAENLVNNNSYYGLGAANLSNYRNVSSTTSSGPGIAGLWFRCNSYDNNLIDECADGSNNLLDGIRNVQGVQALAPYPLTGGPSMTTYHDGLPAGNLFSSGYGYHLYATANVYPFFYNYNDLSTTNPREIPIRNYGVSPSSIKTVTVTAAYCPIAGNIGAGMGNPGDYTTGTAESHDFFPTPMPMRLSNSTDGIVGAMDLKMNICYYMSDSAVLGQPDTLNYWLDIAHSPVAQRTKALSLLANGAIEEGYIAYHSIPDSFYLAPADSIEYNYWGSMLFDVQSRIATKYAHINTAIQSALLTSNPDSAVAGDTTDYYNPGLSAGMVDTLVSIVNGSNYWARNGAENVLLHYAPDTITAILLVSPDTILFPDVVIDSGEARKSAPGDNTVTQQNGETKPVIAVSEIRNSIYPNPVTNILQVNYQLAKEGALVEMQIDDIAGRNVVHQYLQNGKNEVSMKNLPTGTYLYRVYENDKLTMKGKVVKE